MLSFDEEQKWGKDYTSTSAAQCLEVLEAEVTISGLEKKIRKDALMINQENGALGKADEISGTHIAFQRECQRALDSRWGETC